VVSILLQQSKHYVVSISDDHLLTTKATSKAMNKTPHFGTEAAIKRKLPEVGRYEATKSAASTKFQYDFVFCEQRIAVVMNKPA
jgi:hypothetical protein